jgi:hypothetical protein
MAKSGRKPIPENEKKKPLTVVRYFHPSIIEEKGEEILAKMKEAVNKIKI